MKVRQKLLSLMKLNNWREVDLVRKSGVSQPTINLILMGITENPRVDILYPIAKAFDVSIEYLMGYDAKEDNSLIKKGGKVPLIKLADVPLFKENNQNRPSIEGYINESLPLNCYAVKIGAGGQPIFPLNAILIVNPSLDKRDGTYVLVSFNKDTPVIRFLIKDGASFYLRSLLNTNEIEKFSKKIDFWGTVTEQRLYVLE